MFARAYHEVCAEEGAPGYGRIVAFEIDADVLEVARETLHPKLSAAASFRQEDFLSARIAETFSAIVCNPPYYKHHYVPNKAATAGALSAALGTRLPRTLSSYGLFMLKALTLLGPNGRCAFITPAEFLNADYGVPIKECLVRSGTLRWVIFFSPNLAVFDGALTTSAITLLERGARRQHGSIARFVWLDDPAEIRRAFSAVLSTSASQPLADARAGLGQVVEIALAELDAGKKWQSYFATVPPTSVPLVPLSHYGRCMRGIATGANQYFTLSPAEARRLGLGDAEVAPCVTKASHASGYVFDEQSLEGLFKAGKKCLLVDFGPRLSAAARRYVELGEQAGISSRYLPSHRRTWYMQEERPPADFWIPVFFRQRWKVVWNKVRVRSLTAFHGFYLNPFAREFQGPLFLYLNTPLCREILRQQIRHYGDGLNKVEPKDVESVLVPDFSRVSMELIERLDGMFYNALAGRPGASAEETISRADHLLRGALSAPAAPASGQSEDPQ